MIRQLAAAALALGFASLVHAADDPNAPLAGAKQQLQSLRKDDATQKAGTPAGVKLDLPSLNAPEINAPPPPPRREERAGQEKAKARREWLLDGFNKLERRKPSGAVAKEQDEREEDAKPIDPSDPDYFLRVYERQRAQSEAKQLDPGSAPDTRLAATVASDPLAPFMKDWLANSPVRDALRDSAAAGAAHGEATAAGVGAVEAQSRGFSEQSPSNTDSGATRSSGQANPFVQALGLPSIDQPRAADSHPVAALPPPPSANAAPTTVYDLPERAKTDLKLALPPPPSEDKKYFPQLKKF